MQPGTISSHRSYPDNRIIRVLLSSLLDALFWPLPHSNRLSQHTAPSYAAAALLLQNFASSLPHQEPALKAHMMSKTWPIWCKGKGEEARNEGAAWATAGSKHRNHSSSTARVASPKHASRCCLPNTSRFSLPTYKSKCWEIEEQRKNICSLSNQLVGGKDSKQKLSLLSTTFFL